MSKSATASAPKNPTPLPAKSAWARGPPQTAPSPRSQSPAPSTPTHQTHSRRPSTLGQGIPIKDGVSIPRGNVGAVKQGSAVTFGSIDDVSAPISSSPVAAPPIKSEGVKSFGSVPATGHVNGKASISSRASVITPAASSSSSSSSSAAAATTTTPPASTPSATPVAKPKIDIKKMFQNPTSAPTSTPASESSPLQRNINLPMPPPSMHQGQPNHVPHTPLGAHPYTPFVPSGMRPQNSGPNGGPPRSPQYSRPNGSASRSQGGQNGGPPAGLSSPRLGPHPHNPQPPQIPQPPPQMQAQMPPQMHQMNMPWSGYYSYPDQSHYMYQQPWYPSMPMPQAHGQPAPGQHLPPLVGGMPMSPRNPPSSLQTPGTPTLSHAHALPNPVHPPHPPPPISHASNSIGGLTSPPPTPSSTTLPTTNRLNATSNAFVPRHKITVKNPEDGSEVKLENLNKSIYAPTATPATQGSFRQGTPGTPTKRPASIRIESEESRKARLAQEEQKEKEQQRIKAEAEEKARKEKEDAERKIKEAEEKKRQEEEAEKERVRKEEEEKKAEQLRKEEEERARKEAEQREAQRLREEEEERIRKEAEAAEAKRIAEEKAKKEEEERLERERLEQERLEQERLEQEKAEQERMAKEVEEARIRLEQEEEAAKLAQQESEQDGKSESTMEEGELIDDGKDAEPVAPLKDDGKDKPKEGLRINTGSVSPTTDRRQRPGPLDLSIAKSSNILGPQSALATARIIADISTVPYPDGVSSPRPDLNQGAKEGKFRYDREFLLQFMSICKEKPAMLPSLEAIGLEPADQASLSMTRGGSGRRQGPGGAPASRQGPIGLGFPAGTYSKGTAGSFSMGNFATMGGNKLTSEDRFAAASARPVSVSGTAGMQYATNRPTPVTRTLSQGGPGAPLRDRTRSKRGEKRGENNKAPGGQGAGGQQGHGSGFNNFQNQQQQQLNLEPVAPLQATANRWDRKSMQVDVDSPEMVDRKVKGLLNKLTMEKFDSISDQIITWANKSEKEKDGRTLIQVIRLVFEKATDEATWSEMYARLCRKMMEQISSKVQDDGIKNNEGKPIAGGQLFRKYLLNRCQEDFERGWVAKEATAAAAASKAMEDEAIKAANDKTQGDGKDEEIALYSDEYYAAQKAKRQGLGLIKFIGELFKLQMLTERIMHECVKKLLGNVDNPEEEEIESLCKLLTTVGGILDTPKARAHLDVYFSRMKELTKSPNVTPRMQYMLQDLIELRERKWVSRNAVAAPSTIAQIHETAAKEKAAQEKESYQRQISMSRGGSRRGGDRGDYAQTNPDGWAVAGGGSGPSRPPPKAGDLSNFGKINKNAQITFGPSSVFAGKKGAEAKRESISRTSSNSNMFSMLSAQTADAGEGSTKAPEPAQRKRLVLQPRSKPLESETAEAENVTESPVAESESGSEDDVTAEPEMSEADASKKIKEDVKEFFAVRNLEEAEVYFKLPSQYHHLLVDKLVSTAVESKEADAKLVSEFFELSASKELCSPSAFEDGFMPIAELIDDIAIDAPKAFQLFAMMINGAKLDEERRTKLASKSIDSDKLLALLQ